AAASRSRLAHYVTPEERHARQLGPAADQYGLAVLALECLEAAASPGDRPPVPRGVREALTRALSPDPQDPYATGPHPRAAPPAGGAPGVVGRGVRAGGGGGGGGATRADAAAARAWRGTGARARGRRADRLPARVSAARGRDRRRRRAATFSRSGAAAGHRSCGGGAGRATPASAAPPPPHRRRRGTPVRRRDALGRALHRRAPRRAHAHGRPAD